MKVVSLFLFVVHVVLLFPLSSYVFTIVCCTTCCVHNVSGSFSFILLFSCLSSRAAHSCNVNQNIIEKNLFHLLNIKIHFLKRDAICPGNSEPHLIKLFSISLLLGMFVQFPLVGSTISARSFYPFSFGL